MKKKCVPCEGNIRAVSKRNAGDRLKELPQWRLSGDGKSIFSEHRVKDFAKAVRLIGRIARLAEKEGHHPDLHLTGYRRLKVELSTHAIGGLSENDFLLAAKIDSFF